MPTNILDPIATTTIPDSAQENEFELDIRISPLTQNPTLIEDGSSYSLACTGGSCHTSDSIWYAWCCD